MKKKKFSSPKRWCVGNSRRGLLCVCVPARLGKRERMGSAVTMDCCAFTVGNRKEKLHLPQFHQADKLFIVRQAFLLEPDKKIQLLVISLRRNFSASGWGKMKMWKTNFAFKVVLRNFNVSPKTFLRHRASIGDGKNVQSRIKTMRSGGKWFEVDDDDAAGRSEKRFFATTRKANFIFLNARRISRLGELRAVLCPKDLRLMMNEMFGWRSNKRSIADVV